MKIVNNVKEAKELDRIIENCQGSVWLENIKGTRYDLTNKVTRDILFAEILTDNADDDLEIFAAKREDIHSIIDFFQRRTAA